MKKKYLYIIITIIVISVIFWVYLVTLLSPNTQRDIYEGHIYLNKNIPLNGAKIIQDGTNNKIFTYTDNKGYFILKQSKNGNNNIIILHKDKIDTIDLVRRNGVDGTINYLFLRNGLSDTLFLNIHH